MIPQPNVEKTLEKVCSSMLMSHPFYATLALQLTRGAAVSEETKTAATDGIKMFYNPEYVAGLKFAQVKGLLAHEGLHCGMGDPTWMMGKDPELANMATDHVNNLILLQDGFELPPGALADKRFEGMTKDKVYRILEKERQQGQKGGGKPGQKPGQGGGQKPGQQQGQPQAQQGNKPGQQPGQPGGQGKPQAAQTPGGFGQIMPCAAEKKGDQEQIWKRAVEQAAMAATAAGKLPAHLERLVEELRESKVSWAEILKQFVANLIPTDSTWSRPSKRTLSQGIYLPSRIKEGLGELIFAMDYSGSCTHAVTPFSSEIDVVHREFRPSSLVMLSFDTEVHFLGEYGPDEEIEFKIRGGGGTDFRPIFDWVAQEGRTPKALVILTDLYGPFPQTPPDYPVLWVCINRQIAPFGETCRMDLD